MIAGHRIEHGLLEALQRGIYGSVGAAQCYRRKLLRSWACKRAVIARFLGRDQDDRQRLRPNELVADRRNLKIRRYLHRRWMSRKVCKIIAGEDTPSAAFIQLQQAYAAGYCLIKRLGINHPEARTINNLAVALDLEALLVVPAWPCPFARIPAFARRFEDRLRVLGAKNLVIDASRIPNFSPSPFCEADSKCFSGGDLDRLIGLIAISMHSS